MLHLISLLAFISLFSCFKQEVNYHEFACWPEEVRCSFSVLDEVGADTINLRLKLLTGQRVKVIPKFLDLVFPNKAIYRSLNEDEFVLADTGVNFVDLTFVRFQSVQAIGKADTSVLSFRLIDLGFIWPMDKRKWDGNINTLQNSIIKNRYHVFNQVYSDSNIPPIKDLFHSLDARGVIRWCGYSEWSMNCLTIHVDSAGETRKQCSDSLQFVEFESNSDSLFGEVQKSLNGLKYPLRDLNNSGLLEVHTDSSSGKVILPEKPDVLIAICKQ